MIVLIIILSILLFLFLLSLFNVHINLLYNDKPVLTIKVLFLKFVFKPDDEKKKKKVKKKKSKKKKTTKKPVKAPQKTTVKKKKKSPIADLMKRQGLSGFVDIFKDLLSIVAGTLKGFFKHYIIRNLSVDIVIGGEDASDTAIQYGTACAVVYPVLGQIYSRLNVEDYSADIRCDFEEDSKTQVKAQLISSIRIIFVLTVAFKAAARASKAYLKMRFKK